MNSPRTSAPIYAFCHMANWGNTRDWTIIFQSFQCLLIYMYPESGSQTPIVKLWLYSISSQGTTSVARATISILLKGAIYGKNLIISAHLFHSTPAILWSYALYYNVCVTRSTTHPKGNHKESAKDDWWWKACSTLVLHIPSQLGLTSLETKHIPESKRMQTKHGQSLGQLRG